MKLLCLALAVAPLSAWAAEPTTALAAERTQMVQDLSIRGSLPEAHFRWPEVWKRVGLLCGTVRIGFLSGPGFQDLRRGLRDGAFSNW